MYVNTGEILNGRNQFLPADSRNGRWTGEYTGRGKRVRVGISAEELEEEIWEIEHGGKEGEDEAARVGRGCEVQ